MKLAVLLLLLSGVTLDQARTLVDATKWKYVPARNETRVLVELRFDTR